MKTNESKQLIVCFIFLCVVSFIYAAVYRTNNAEIAEINSAEQETEQATSIDPVDVNIISVDNEPTTTATEEVGVTTTEKQIEIVAEPSTVATEEVIVQPYSDYSDLEYLSAIIYAEAGNQCYAGQLAVGIVVMNRVRSGSFPSTIKEVLYQPGQFTPASSGSLSNAISMYRNGSLPESCISAAQEALNGRTNVEYDGQVYEMNDFLFFSRYRQDCRLQIQDHQFS